MKLLITGAYGLVGSNICKILEEKYKDIEVTKIKFDAIENKWSKFDYIIHCAGYGQPLKFIEDKVKTILINTRTVWELFEYCLKPEGKFLFVSSSEIYSGAIPPYHETDIGTTTPQHPRACYIESKRCGEAICMAYREQGYDVKIARLALAYGATKKGDTRVLNQFVEQALTTKEIKLLDRGEAKRTYCYVEDAADMLLEILFKGTQPVYNVGGQSTTTIKELAEKIGKITGAKVVLGTKGLVGAPEDVRVSMALTLTEFPRTFVSLDEGLKRTIDYQRKLYE